MEMTEKQRTSYQRTTLGIALITSFCTPFTGTALNIAVPHIGKEFNSSVASLTWIVVSFLFVAALCSIPFGRIADIYGRRRILKIGILLFSFASFINIFTPNMGMFILVRVLQGIGSAMIFGTNVPILVEAFPPEKRGSIIGLSVTGVYTGASCGPIVGGFITHSFGWRGIFLLVAVLALISFIMMMVKAPQESKAENPEKLNMSSIIYFILSLGLFLYGLVTLSQHLWSYFILAAGGVLIVFYIRHEMRAEGPVIEVRLFKNRNFSLSSLAALFNFASVFAISYLMSIYLQVARGFDADQSGLIMICQPVLQAILSPIAGRLSDKKSPAAIATIGMACSACALGMFAFVNEQTSVMYIMAGLLLTGVGIGLFSSPNTTVIMSSVSSKDYGVTSSVISTMRSLGQSVGMALLTVIINYTIGNTPIAEVMPDVLVRNMQISFTVFASLCFVGMLFSMQRRKKKEQL